jgi:hypothetical protein
VNNFVTERNSAEVMAVGLNAVRWVSILLRDPDPDIYPSRIPDLGSWMMAVGLNAVRWVSTDIYPSRIQDPGPGSRISDLGSRISDPGSN